MTYQIGEEKVFYVLGSSWVCPLRGEEDRVLELSLDIELEAKGARRAKSVDEREKMRRRKGKAQKGWWYMVVYKRKFRRIEKG